jgi:hypothetical protein
MPTLNGREPTIFAGRRRYLVKILGFSGTLVLFVLFACLPGYSVEKFQAGADFTLGFPQGEFERNVNKIGIGGSGYFAYKFKKSFFSAGASIGVLVYGSETRKELLSLAIPEVVVNVRTSNNILMCHFMLRIQPPEGKFRPYVEGLVGFQYLWTETGVYDRGCCDEKIASSVNQNDWTWSSGAGCGLSMKVYDHGKNRERDTFAIFVDFGVRYLKGGKAEYLSEGSIRQEDGQLIYEIKMSHTDLITARLGLTFAF